MGRWFASHATLLGIATLLRIGNAIGAAATSMPGQSFALTPQQIDNLKRWTEFLQTDKSKEWDREEREASKNFNRILSEAKFLEGEDLDAKQLDDLLSNMRKMIGNRALNKLLYTDNGIPNFNSKLRNLLFGSDALPERIDEFYELDWVGKPTMSQFLYAFKPEAYPCITRQTLEPLELDSAQLDEAYRQALQEHGISRAEDHNALTVEYLRDWVVFREVKRVLGLEIYTEINHILWNEYDTRRKGKVEPPSGAEEPPILPIAAHEDAEGVLIQLGNLLGFDTYTSDPSKMHAGKKLGEIAVLKDIPAFTHQKILDAARKIDVIWFKEEFPEYCFEVEHTTNVKDGLLRLYQVRRLDWCKFFIVAPQEVYSKFEAEVVRDPFNSIRSRYAFKSYEALRLLYQVASKYHDLKSKFGIG